MLRSFIVPDDRRAISEGVKELLDCGIDLLVTTMGLSVDPDDVTRQGLMEAGATNILYGAPILPGAMTLLANIGPVQLMGVPACALYFKTTSFDLLLPRLLAGLTITRKDLARMANGAFCLECKCALFPRNVRSVSNQKELEILTFDPQIGEAMKLYSLKARWWRSKKA